MRAVSRVKRKVKRFYRKNHVACWFAALTALVVFVSLDAISGFIPGAVMIN